MAGKGHTRPRPDPCLSKKNAVLLTAVVSWSVWRGGQSLLLANWLQNLQSDGTEQDLDADCLILDDLGRQVS